MAFLAIALAISFVNQQVHPVDLKCENRVNPLGVDARPKLSWILSAQAGSHNVSQTASQILVASSLKALNRNQGDLWNSGKVRSDQSIGIAYQGHSIHSSQEVFWKVRIWDQNGHPSPWSNPAQWTAGIVRPEDWRARWIEGTPQQAQEQTKGGTLLARKEFTAPSASKLKRAIVHVCGLGQYELSLNGSKVGHYLLAPGWTNYRKTCLYDTYDVTRQIKPGANAIGIELGSGMYNVVGGRYTKFTGSFGPLKAIVQLEMEYADGTKQTIGTDETWRVKSGPITFSSPYGGEDYDARREPTGWKTPGFKEEWSPAVVAASPGGTLRGSSASAPPIVAQETLHPVSIHQVGPNDVVYDLGQNASIIPRLIIQGAPGSTVKITPAELIHPDGTVDRRSVGGGEAYWKYTFASNQPVTWFPKFFYQGARYLQVSCEGANVKSLEAVVIQSDSRSVGTFSCSNELFNRIYTLVRWAQRSNMVSVLTDCPHRERLGWLEQTHLNGPSLRYSFGLGSFFAKIENDIEEAQTKTGFVPDIAPEFVNFGSGPEDYSNPFRNSTEWGAAFLLVPWQQYEFEGDLDILRKHYPAMKRYVDWLTTQAKDSILSFGLGDWYDIGPGSPGFSQLTPIPLTATAFYYQDSEILAKTAKLLKRTEDAKFYSQQAEAIKAAINLKYYNSVSHQYGTGSQCANSIALVMNLAPEKDRSAITENIVRDLEAKGLTAGDVGYRYLLRALAADNSYNIDQMNSQDTKPGYGYQLAHGATSLTEAWDANPNSSQNHFMLGQINEWFFHDLAGIQCDPEGPGFKKMIIRPVLNPGLDVSWVKASYDSPYGKITSAWSSAGGSTFNLTVEIPPNTTAQICLPDNIELSFKGHFVVRKKRAGDPSHNTYYKIGSGHYKFYAKWTNPL